MRISGTDIYMTRGDTETISIMFHGYTPQPGDAVEMTVRRNVGSAAVIYKRITEFDDNKAVISIEPDDTTPLRFGQYVYDIQLTYGGAIRTVITPSKFTIGEEVTYGYNR